MSELRIDHSSLLTETAANDDQPMAFKADAILDTIDNAFVSARPTAKRAEFYSVLMERLRQRTQDLVPIVSNDTNGLTQPENSSINWVGEFLVLAADNARFAIDRTDVHEVVDTQTNKAHRVEWVGKTPLLRLRQQLVPLISLTALLGHETANDAETAIVIIRRESGRFGLMVNRIQEARRLEVQHLTPIKDNQSIFSGNAVIEDDGVVLVLDSDAVAAKAGLRPEDIPPLEDNDNVDLDHALDDHIRFVVFSCADDARRAIPLNQIERFERVSPEMLEYAGGRLVTQYREQLMPLVGLNGDPQETVSTDTPVLVLAEGERRCGIVVKQVHDIHTGKLQPAPVPGAEIIGTTLVEDRVTDVVCVMSLLAGQGIDWSRDSMI